jgi:TetR/AcrR family transcriptional repressor of nem operon
MAGKTPTGTAQRILDVAEALVQRRGWGAFSYGDIAAQLEVSTASLHYHYRGKAALGAALIGRYAERFDAALEEIGRERPTAPARLRDYARLYADVLVGGRMCLCGILAAEYATLPEPMHTAIVGFFDENVRWLAAVLAQGLAAGEISFTGEAEQAAATLLAGLEGAMLVARPYDDPEMFESTAGRLLDALCPAI